MTSAWHESPNDFLGRQRNPEPPAQPVAPAPSLWLYVAMALVAATLLAASLIKGSEGWASFCLNLGTEILGAVLILLIVERRLRQDELRAFRRLPLKTKLSIMVTLFPDVRHALGYVHILQGQMDKIAKPFLDTRQELVDTIAARLSTGVMLTGGVRTGKTTLIHLIVRRQIATVMRQPRSASIPILVAGQNWAEESLEEKLFETMRSFYPIPARTFQYLLRHGRLLCIFDNVDDAIDPLERLRRIAEFLKKHPGNAIVLSSQSAPDTMLRILESMNIGRIEIPQLSAEERARLEEMRARLSHE